MLVHWSCCQTQHILLAEDVGNVAGCVDSSHGLVCDTDTMDADVVNVLKGSGKQLTFAYSGGIGEEYAMRDVRKPR